MHKVLRTLEEKRPKWISMQLQKARKLCSDRSEVELFDLARGWNATKFINVFTPSKKEMLIHRQSQRVLIIPVHLQQKIRRYFTHIILNINSLL